MLHWLDECDTVSQAGSVIFNVLSPPNTQTTCLSRWRQCWSLKPSLLLLLFDEVNLCVSVCPMYQQGDWWHTLSHLLVLWGLSGLCGFSGWYSTCNRWVIVHSWKGLTSIATTEILDCKCLFSLFKFRSDPLHNNHKVKTSGNEWLIDSTMHRNPLSRFTHNPITSIKAPLCVKVKRPWRTGALQLSL